MSIWVAVAAVWVACAVCAVLFMRGAHVEPETAVADTGEEPLVAPRRAGAESQA
jgi:hypothetical protein